MSNFDMATSESTRHRDYQQGRGEVAKGVGMESMLSSDLQDWLRLTHWHDTEFREEKLSNYRRKEGRESDVSPYVDKYQAYGRPAEENELTQAGILEASKGPKTSFKIPRRNNAGSQKPRARSTSPAELHRDKHTSYRIRDYPESRRKENSKPRVDDGQSIGHSRRLTDSSTYVASSSLVSDLHNTPGGQIPTDSRDFARERATRCRPKSFKIGDKGTVRFFVMRSGSWNNVYNSMEDGIWATNINKADQLGDILSSGITVVLFFAVNHSHGFQGYAIMKSIPSKDVHHPRWWYNVRWNISEPFKVEWIVKEHVETTRVTHIINGLNYDLPVTRSSNGQELSYSAGLQMVAIIDAHARDMFALTERSR
ncbi:YT521-B-like domain-containing protein [Annulohypoxylon maeteangense]|uniref:YT521-B-like domain-containing protein n=1 Tax=Annulohypoxylon maeteangense TaxID=1927788 RepID=UPI0020084D40|nr:YT521-B-like domain-containing protein [Annulohypoxylon maeteangense]KAI0887760.1 YT521-B-like domain-containing protein [Annulohypoxylon maeteangense]